MLRLRFLHVVDGTTLYCEGTIKPQIGQRVRATGSQGNGFLVTEVIERDKMPETAISGPLNFGLRLRHGEVPWSPDTPIEIVRARDAR